MDWSILGSDNQKIIGSTHLPRGEHHARPRAAMLLAHGFKGYKDYGFLPHLAQAAADAGLVAHRFNFSHSGMTRKTRTFERPDLFEKDTWGRQVFDLSCVSRAAVRGELPGRHAGLPQVWFGHSRGGVTVLLTAARAFEEIDDKGPPAPPPVAIVSAAAPDRANFMSPQGTDALRAQGYVDSPSSRTGQVLRVGKPWLDEIEHNPDALDPLLAIARVRCPVLVVHGDADATVPLDSADRLVQCGGQHAQRVTIAGASHVFHCPNPLPLGRAVPAKTKQFIDAVMAFIERALK